MRDGVMRRCILLGMLSIYPIIYHLKHSNIYNSVGLFAPKDSIHHFADFGYSHAPCSRCPQDEESHTSGRCLCNRNTHFDADSYSCLPRWWNVAGVNKGAKRDWEY
jgi:hypothetical protein